MAKAPWSPESSLSRTIIRTSLYGLLSHSKTSLTITQSTSIMSAAVLARKPTIIDLDSEDEDASFLDALDVRTPLASALLVCGCSVIAQEVERVACSPRRPIASGSSRTLSASPAPCHILQPTVAAKTRIIVPAKRRLVAHASDIIDLTGNASSQETIVAGPYTTKRAKKPSTSPAPESSRKGKEREKSAAPIIEVDLEDDFTCGICMERALYSLAYVEG